MQKETHTFLFIDARKETATASFMQIIRITRNGKVWEPGNNAHQMQTSHILLSFEMRQKQKRRKGGAFNRL
jgi:hypothetical protein